jgi:hypothetical protein
MVEKLTGLPSEGSRGVLAARRIAARWGPPIRSSELLQGVLTFRGSLADIVPGRKVGGEGLSTTGEPGSDVCAAPWMSASLEH